MDIVQSLGKNVRRLRLAGELSQEELAFAAGMKRSYLSDLERGTRNPTVRALVRLAEALGVHPSKLLEIGGSTKNYGAVSLDILVPRGHTANALSRV